MIKEAENINPDFIISTVPLKMNQYKVIEVNPLLNAEDVNVIRRNLTNLSYNRRNEHLAKQMEAIHKMPMEELFQKIVVSLISKFQIGKRLYRLRQIH